MVQSGAGLKILKTNLKARTEIFLRRSVSAEEGKTHGKFAKTHQVGLRVCGVVGGSGGWRGSKKAFRYRLVWWPSNSKISELNTGWT